MIMTPVILTSIRKARRILMVRKGLAQPVLLVLFSIYLMRNTNKSVKFMANIEKTRSSGPYGPFPSSSCRGLVAFGHKVALRAT